VKNLTASGVGNPCPLVAASVLGVEVGVNFYSESFDVCFFHNSNLLVKIKSSENGVL